VCDETVDLDLERTISVRVCTEQSMEVW
jgi:hypothetical protein